MKATEPEKPKLLDLLRNTIRRKHRVASPCVSNDSTKSI